MLKREEDVLLEFELQQFIQNLSSDDAVSSSDQNEDISASPEKNGVPIISEEQKLLAKFERRKQRKLQKQK